MMTGRTQLKAYADIARLLARHRSMRHLDPGQPLDAEGTEEVAQAGRQLADDLESLGPTFIKLGQLLSTRSDLLPEPFLHALARLQDDVAPLPAHVAREVFEDEMSVSVRDAFGSFDDTPLAAASLGQVHRATLRDGRPVVVKVQRPGVDSEVAADIAALGEMAKVLEDHSDAGRRFGFSDLFDQFRRSLLDELDYTREAANLARLRRDLAAHHRIVVPQPIDDLTGRRVLTMEFVAGRKITELGPLAHLDLDGATLVDALVRAYLEQIFVRGFFHADPHPGNVLLTPDHRIGLVDLGMVGYLREEVRAQLGRLVLAVQTDRGEDVAEVLVRLGRRLDEFDEQRLRREVSDLVARTSAGAGRGGEVVMRLSQVCGACGLRPPPELAMVARALLSLEEVALALDPSLQPNHVLTRHATEVLESQLRSSPASLVGALVDAKDFAEQLPGRINRVMDALAHGDLQVRVHAFDEAEALRTLQNLGNRLVMGLVIAALLIGAALLIRVPSSSHILGYPSVAFVSFVVAALCGLVLIASIVFADRHTKRWARRHRRR